MSSLLAVGSEGPRPKQAVVRSHTVALDVGQNDNCRTNEGSSEHGPSPSRLEEREPGGDSKSRKGE